MERWFAVLPAVSRPTIYAFWANRIWFPTFETKKLRWVAGQFRNTCPADNYSIYRFYFLGSFRMLVDIVMIYIFLLAFTLVALFVSVGAVNWSFLIFFFNF